MRYRVRIKSQDRILKDFGVPGRIYQWKDPIKLTPENYVTLEFFNRLPADHIINVVYENTNYDGTKTYRVIEFNWIIHENVIEQFIIEHYVVKTLVKGGI